MIIMSLRGAVVATQQSPNLRGDCFAACARNDMQAKVNALRELESASGDASQVAPALWAAAGVDSVNS